MSRYIKDEVIVLKSYPLKDNDKIFVFLSKNNGIIKGVGKGVRRQNSKTKGKLMPFMHLKIMFIDGKSELYTISEVDIIRPYAQIIVKNYDFYTVSNVLIELSEKINFFSQNTTNQFLLLKGALSEIEKSENNTKVILSAFFIKSLFLAGISPNIKSCVICQNDVQNKMLNFSNYSGGIVCDKCKSENNIFTKSISVDNVKYISDVGNNRWENAKNYNNNVQMESLKLLASFTQNQLENKIKSLKHLAFV